VACRAADGSWSVPPGLAAARSAPRLCATADRVNAVPRTAFEGQQLAVVQRAASAPTVWLGHRWRPGRRWQRFERSGCGPELVRGERRRRVRRGVASFVVRLRAPCTGQGFKRRLVVRGGQRAVRGRTGRRLRVPVARGTRELSVRYRYRGTVRVATILLRRR
jgi:hypothetical protein